MHAIWLSHNSFISSYPRGADDARRLFCVQHSWKGTWSIIEISSRYLVHPHGVGRKDHCKVSRLCIRNDRWTVWLLKSSFACSEMLCKLKEKNCLLNIHLVAVSSYLSDHGKGAVNRQYCRFSRDKALNCLDNKRITLVGDSVSMQLCSYLQCAYHGMTTLQAISHYEYACAWLVEVMKTYLASQAYVPESNLRKWR